MTGVPHMLLIGLTGGIASGKSSVSQILRDMGATVIDSDANVRELQEPGQPVFQAIVAAFGPPVVGADGRLDRQALGDLVFRDAAERRRLEQIVHPAVRQRMWEQVAAARAQGLPAVVIDVPLLIEVGLHQQMDQIWVVYVDPQTQLSRLQRRDGAGEEEARRRVAAQMPLAEKVKLAHLVVDNNGSLTATREQVAAAWAAALAAAEAEATA